MYTYIKELSDPERSTKCNLDTVLTSLPAGLASIYTINMQWDLVEASFLGVSQTTLLVSPINNKFNASSSA